jgi:CheY-like chemotaxis protein
MKGASIFLVEDEALIRMMIVEMLEELGHQVVAEAGSIETAEPLARTPCSIWRFSTSMSLASISVPSRRLSRREVCIR